MKNKQRKFTEKQKRFVAEYQKDSNGAQAAIRAGFSPRTAREIAYQLLHKTSHVMEAIQREEDERLRQIGVTREKALTELARIGLSDIRKLYDEDGRLKHPKDWDPDTAAAVAGVEVTEEFEGTRKDRELVGTTKKVRVFDKVRALELLSKHLGIIGNGKHKDHEEEGEDFGRVLTTLELSAKIVYLVKLAVERKKEIEAQKALSGKSQDEKPKNY